MASNYTVNYVRSATRKIEKLNLSNNSCSICGSQPEDFRTPMNFGPIRYWEPDDGWTIGTLCRSCYLDYGNAQPKPDDYAYSVRDEYAASIDTDEDPFLAMIGE